MSDGKTPIVKLVPDAIDNAAKNLSDAPSKAMGQTISDLWFLVFGGITQVAEKRREKYKAALEQYKKELTASLDKVPEENHIEPSSQVVLSALDESKFCVEEEELRKLFVSLITSATDSRKTAHPSFANIIRQMSPEDALFLSVFKQRVALPLCSFRQKLSESSGVTVAENLCYTTPEGFTDEQTSLSISSLIRLGICTIPAGLYLSDASLYEPFKEDILYKSLISFYGPDKIEIQKKYLELTPFGKLFIACCLP